VVAALQRCRGVWLSPQPS